MTLHIARSQLVLTGTPAERVGADILNAAELLSPEHEEEMLGTRQLDGRISKLAGLVTRLSVWSSTTDQQVRNNLGLDRRKIHNANSVLMNTALQLDLDHLETRVHESIDHPLRSSLLWQEVTEPQTEGVQPQLRADIGYLAAQLMAGRSMDTI